MFKRILLSACMMVASGSAEAKPADVVAAYVRDTKISCYKQDGQSTCPLAMTAAKPTVFQVHGGRHDGEIFAWIVYQADVTGNAIDQMFVIFAKRNGKVSPVARLDRTFGTNPRAIVVSQTGPVTERVDYTGTIVSLNGSRARPRGSLRFSISITPHGLHTAFTKTRALSNAMR